jgi:hypothetical protein
MNKTDKLVAAALETEFRHYRNSELQHIKAVNDGEHGDLKPLPVPSKYQSSKAFKDQRLNWWRELFDSRVTLVEAAGLLLGFSQTMTGDAKFTDDHKSKHDPKYKPLFPTLMGRDLLDAFTDMRGDIADWRVPSDGKYRAADLFTWAKEKGFVADEVLAAWVAHNKAEAGEVEQVTAQATTDAVEAGQVTAQATTGNTPRVECHTTKGKRSDTLTPVIEHAQSLCKSLKQDEWDTAEVWGKLHTLTAEKYTVLMHLEGDAVVYTDGDKTKKLTKKMLGDRLRGMRKRQANAA